MICKYFQKGLYYTKRRLFTMSVTVLSSGKLIPGSGVLAKALQDEGYRVIDAEDIGNDI